MTAVIIRIVLRYGAGALIAHGLLDAESGNFLADDPDVVMLIETGVGVALAGLSEGWYWLAHKWGWAR